MKKKYIILGIFILALSTSSLIAQNAIIKGIIMDEQNKLPIEFASVSLLKQKDTSIIYGILTKESGAFTMKGIDTGKYFIKVYANGYPIFQLPILISQKNELISLDSIRLKYASINLGSVLVNSKRTDISNKLEKQIYRAQQFESAKGATAIDILKNLPSVTVNGSGEISVRGASGFLILINGKAVIADPLTILNQLPANSIENIELITAPSAKYDADGKGGIVNIVTKKSSTDGISLQTNLQGGLPSVNNYANLEKPMRFGGDVTLSFRKKKWDILLASNYNRNDANGSRTGDVFTKNYLLQILTKFPSNGERSFDRYNYGVRTSINYSATKNDIFNVGYFSSKKYQQRRADIIYNNSVANLNTGAIIKQFTYFNSNLQTKEGEFQLASFDYTHTFKNNSKIIATTIYENASLYGITVNKNMDFPSKNNIFQLVNNPYSNPIDGYRLSIDYIIPIGNGKFETGLLYRKDKQDGKFDYQVSPISVQSDMARFKGTAKSVNLINAVYTQYSNKIEKLTYTTGLRYEHARRNIDLSTDLNTYPLTLNNLFPSVNLLYTINTSWNAKGGYSKRVQRNNNFELNPIPEREHSETLEQGDPNLLPQFVDLVELGINHNFKKGNIFSTLYFQNIKNPIQRVNSVYADTILNRLFTNAEKARLIGLETGANFKPTSWLSSYIGANIYNYKIEGKLNVLGNVSQVDNADWVYSINTNNSIDFGKNWGLNINVNYISSKPTAQGQDSRFLSPNSSIKKTFMEGALTFSLQWQNMDLGFLNSNQQRISTWGERFYTTTNYIYETEVFLLNVGFNLNKFKIKTKLPTSELVEKEF